MTIQVKRILVAKDLSKESSNVIRYALELGSKFDAEIHVLHVMPTVDHAVLNMVAISMGPDKLAELNAMNEKDLGEKTRQQLNAILEEETRQGDVQLSTPPQVEVHHGEAAPMILQVADRLDAPQHRALRFVPLVLDDRHRSSRRARRQARGHDERLGWLLSWDPSSQ